MATEKQSVYAKMDTITVTAEDEAREKMYINDVALTVLPSDIASFQNNAVFEESYLRSKAVFAFRSKYSSNKVIITLPISVSPVTTTNDNDAKSQKDGLKVLTQLTKYPYCFIRSARVRSYVSARARLSSTGFMMFAVDEVNVVQDQRSPDMLFAEFHLLLCDFTSLTDDFYFRGDKIDATSYQEVYEPSNSQLFTEAFEFGFEETYNEIFSAAKDMCFPNGEGPYIQTTATPFNMIQLLAPCVVAKTELGSGDYDENFVKDIVANYDYKEIKITAKNGNNSFTPEFLDNVNEQKPIDENYVPADIADATTSVLVYWTNFHDLSFGGVSSVQSLKFSFKNKLAQHFVGSHKYPFIQYMGRYPSRFNISLKYATGEFYGNMEKFGFSQDQSSVVSTLGQLNNVLDYNNEMFPEASAYNTIKINSIVSKLVGLDNLVPNQTFISSSANPESQGMEDVQISFIEADVDDFMQMSKPFPGRPSWYESGNSVEAKAILGLYKAFRNASVRDQIEKGEHVKLYESLAKAMSQAVKTGAGEFFGNVDANKIYEAVGDLVKFKDEVDKMDSSPYKDVASKELQSFINDKQLRDLKNYSTGKSGYVWPSPGIIYNNSFDPSNNELFIGFLERRASIMSSIKQNDKDGSKLSLEESMYRSNQKSNNAITEAYGYLRQAANNGDPIAAVIIKNTSGGGDLGEEALVDYANSYIGSNLEDLGLPALANPEVSPFYFLLFRPYYTSDSFKTISNSVDKEVIKGINEVISKKLDDVQYDQSSHFGIFNNESGVTVKEMRIADNNNPTADYWSTSSFGYLGSAYGTGVDRGGSWEGVPGTNANYKAYDHLILASANKHGVPPGLVKAVIHTESTFNPNARSPVGAKGLMQMMPDTAARFKVSNPYDPAQSIEGGTTYLAWLIKRFKGNYKYALAGYNSGEGNVDKHGGMPPFRETRDYVERVMKRWNELYNDDSLVTTANGNAKGSRLTEANTANNTYNARALQQAQLEQRYNDGTLDTSGLQKAKVIEVVDGDTVIVSPLDEKGKEGPSIQIRVKYLDTPEKEGGFDGDKPKTLEGVPVDAVFKGNPGGYKATTIAKQLLPTNGIVYIDAMREQDKYNRTLSNIYLAGGKELYAEKLVASGYGAPWNFEQGGGGPILNKLKSMSSTFDSKTTTQYKSEMTLVRDRITKAKNLDEVKSILIQYKNILSSSKFKYGKEIHDLNVTTGTKEDKLAVTSIKVGTYNPTKASVTGNFPVTNMYIHLLGLQKDDKSNEKLVKSWFGARSGTIHEGLDITSHGTSPNVVAAAGGTAYTFYTGGGGKTVVIDHHNGFVTRYMHLARFGVKHRQTVKAGQGIGIVGNTNSKQGTYDSSVSKILKHLHMETWVFKDYNPQARMYAVNPWNTTALNLLDGLDGKEVWKNISKFISPKQYVTGVNSKVKERVYGYGGTGKAGILSGVAASETAAVVEGKTIQAKIQSGDPAFTTSSTYENMPLDGVDLTSATIREVDNLPPASSVYYEPGSMGLHYDNMAYHAQLSLNVAFPVVKVYVVVGNEVEDPYVFGSIKLNHYFEIKGVQDVRINCNNDDTPVDTMLLSIANPSFIRTDTTSVAGINVTRDFTNIATEAEVSFMADRIRLFPGARLHVRMGYSNNPNKLRTVFNGTITELANESSITINVLAEGYGRELLVNQLYPGKPEFSRSIDTPQLISRAMSEVEGINSFGNKIGKFRHFNIFKDSDDLADPETKRLTTNYTNVWKFFEPGNHRQRMYTNIYAAEVERLHSNYNTSLKNHLQLFNIFDDSRSAINEQLGFGYAFNGQTPWDVLKEMEFRHPGTKVKPLFFQDRMTMFFGLKEQMYIARDLDPTYMKMVGTGTDEKMKEDYILKRPIRFDIVTGFHIASSETNILMNNMKINSKFNTCANVVYFDNTSNMAEGDVNSASNFEMKIDDTITAFDERYGTVRMRGIHGKYSAFMYGTTYLRREAEKMYGGTITLTGNPCIKAGDFIYLNDNMRRFEGLIKVRECKHYMNAQTGFTTEIVPGMFVEARNFIYSGLMLKLAFIAKIGLANSSFSINIASNDEVDFRTYQNYLEKLKYYARRKGSKADDWNWNWAPAIVNDFVYDTAGTPVIGMAMGVGSAISLSRLVTSGKTVTGILAKGAAHSASIRAELASISSASSFIKGIWAYSGTSVDLLKYSRDKVKAARTTFSAFGLIKGGLGVAGAASWFVASRSLMTLASVASAALLTNPIGWLIRAAVSLAFAYLGAKMQEAELTRQPLLLMPIACNGRPYLAGISGYRYDSYFEAKLENWKRNTETISKAAYLVSMTSKSTTASVMGTWLKGTFEESRVESVRKAFKNKLDPDVLERTVLEAEGR